MVVIQFCLPVEQPSPPQYLVHVASEGWISSKSTAYFSTRNVRIPDRIKNTTDLLNLYPVPISTLPTKFQSFYPYSYFNPVQSQAFYSCFHTDRNILFGAPTGSGKTTIGELTVFRMLTQPNTMKKRCVYIAPMKALTRERMSDWTKKFGSIGYNVVELTGDANPDIRAINNANIIVTTPEKWDGISRQWKTRKYVRTVNLMIFDEIHMLGSDRGPIIEIILSRMRLMAQEMDLPIRFVALSTALANAKDIADWMNVDVHGLFNFGHSLRPVPCNIYIQGFSGEAYCPRMGKMNRPAFMAIKQYSDGKPSIVFVSSRRQTRLTAFDFVTLLAADDRYTSQQFLNVPDEELEAFQHDISQITDDALKRTISYGIGIHHAGLVTKDRQIVEKLFRTTKILVLVCTATLAWGVNFPARLVIVKGTEHYDGVLNTYVDQPITDILQMVGRAGRPQFDDEAVACVFVMERKKNFYRTFLYEPFPVESSLYQCLLEHLNAEVASGAINNQKEAVDWLTWTYFYRRLTANPHYYLAKYQVQNDECDDDEGIEWEDGEDATLTKGYENALTDDKLRGEVKQFILELIDNNIEVLVKCSCIEFYKAEFDFEKGYDKLTSLRIRPTRLGLICSLYYLSPHTISLFHEALAESFDKEQNLGVVKIMRLICNALEFELLPVRHNEDCLNKELSDKCPLTFDEFDDRFTDWGTGNAKAFLLIQAKIFRIELPVSDYISDTKSVIDQLPRMIQALIDLSAGSASAETTMNIVRFNQMITEGWHPLRSELWADLPQVKGSKLSILNSLNEIGVHKRVDLFNKGALDLIRRTISDENSKFLMKKVATFPRLVLRLRDASGNLKEVPKILSMKVIDEVVLKINISQTNAGTTACEKSSFFLFLVDEECNEIVVFRRGKCNGGNTKRRGNGSDLEMKFPLPTENNGKIDLSLSLYLLMDTVYGLDQYAKLNLSLTN